MTKRSVIFIVGPTAIGKTSLSVKLARKVGGEIISCDSMQIYKDMGVLSQAPTLSQRKGVKHYLVEGLLPQREYSAASFRKKASLLIESIFKRGKVPIIVGGSGLYVKALVDGLFPSPRADMKFRKNMENAALRSGSAELHKKLSRIDDEAAGKIHPNDTRRIIRALELHHSTGRTMTELKAETEGLANKYDVKIFGLNASSRDGLYDRINLRVERMFRQGAAGQVKMLSGKRLSKTAKGVLGYKEILGYLNCEYGIEEAKDMLKMNTRRFAKRQLTWFRADKRIKWFDVDSVSEKWIVEEIRKSLGKLRG